MPFLKMRVLLKARPIAHYVLAFLVILAIALSVMAGAVFRDIAQLDEQVQRSDEKLARQELNEAIELLFNHAERAVKSLTQWDEARVQLEDSTYYSYWRNARALSAGVLPKSLDAVDLYDRQGRNLSHARTDESTMPPVILDMRPTVIQERGHAHLYVFARFYADPKQSQQLGYAGLKIDLLEELRGLRKFRYLDLGTLYFEAREGERILLADIMQHLRFRPVANPETRALQKIATRSFFELALLIAASSLLGYFALLSIVAKPLRRLSDHIESMKRGQGGFLGASYRGALAISELENVRHSLNDYQQQLDDMHLSLANKNEELWVLAHRDPLTGVYNRRAFDDDWQTMRRVQGVAVAQVAFLLFDCDHFKAINDTYGHQVGDRIIQGLAESLHMALRAGDRLYRLGGDEFATVLFGADPVSARYVAERCMEQVNRRDFIQHGVKEPVRISIGIAYAPSTEDDTLVLLHRQADLAMYHAKRPGQTKIVMYSSEMGDGNVAMVSNAEVSAVYQAIADPELMEMHYQPVMQLPGKLLAYYEALVRIRHGDTLIMPSGIFPVVELRGLECDLDLAVFERIWRDMQAGKIPKGTGVSINVSGPGIVNARVLEKLLTFVPLLADYKLVLEVTETSLITQIAQASANLNQLRQAGFRIALDDFGSGYSSLRYLSSMPVDLVKFDISMVRSLEDMGRSSLFVKDLARMIQDAGYELVAEGIESEALLRRVGEIGFSHAQGFYIGRPAPLPVQR
jgi:diguanylate cyclase (GGDEF)-like protein